MIRDDSSSEGKKERSNLIGEFGSGGNRLRNRVHDHVGGD